MIIVLKIISPILLLGIAILQLGLEHRWRDRRTIRHKRVRIFLVILMVIFAIVGVSSVVIGDREDRFILNSQRELKIEAKEREALAIKHRERIEQQMINFEKQLAPFIDLSSERYPDDLTVTALEKMLADIKGAISNLKTATTEKPVKTINSLTIEGRLTCDLKEGAALPPAEARFIPVSDAHAYFEGPAGRARIDFSSPVMFRNIGKGKIVIVNIFKMIPGGPLQGRPLDFLRNFDTLSLPFITIVYGKSLKTIRLLEVSIEVNGKVAWYKSWPYDVPFQLGPRFNVPLSEFHGKIESN